jgi:hypothetical protein
MQIRRRTLLRPLFERRALKARRLLSVESPVPRCQGSAPLVPLLYRLGQLPPGAEIDPDSPPPKFAGGQFAGKMVSFLIG